MKNPSFSLISLWEKEGFIHFKVGRGLLKAKVMKEVDAGRDGEHEAEETGCLLPLSLLVTS